MLSNVSIGHLHRLVMCMHMALAYVKLGTNTCVERAEWWLNHSLQAVHLCKLPREKVRVQFAAAHSPFLNHGHPGVELETSEPFGAGRKVPEKQAVSKPCGA